jgi:hypothetical protein
MVPMLRSRFIIYPFAIILFVMLNGCQMLSLKQTFAPLVARLPTLTPALKPSASLDPTCVVRCERAQTHCEQRQQLRESECQQHFNPTNASHATCTAAQRPDCLQPVACLGADLGICKTQQHDCLNACPPVKNPAESAPAPAAVTPQSAPPLPPNQATASAAAS